MPNNQTKQLTHGAMMIALFAILMAIAYYIPVIYIVGALLAPLPIAWYSAKYKLSSSIFIMVIAVVISFFLGGLIIIPFALIFAAMGVAIGDSLRRKKSKIFLLISTGLTLLITFALIYVISLILLGFDLIRDSLQLARDSYTEMVTMAEDMTGQVVVTQEKLDQMFKMIDTSLPAAITLSVFMLAFIVISVNLPLLKRLKVEVPKFNEFKHMRLPKALLWYYLIVLTITLFIQPEMGTMLYVITQNFSLVLWVLLTLQGVSLIFFVIDEAKLPSFLKVVAAIFSIPFYSIILLVGVIDLGFDLRKFILGKTKT